MQFRSMGWAEGTTRPPSDHHAWAECSLITLLAMSSSWRGPRAALSRSRRRSKSNHFDLLKALRPECSILCGFRIQPITPANKQVLAGVSWTKGAVVRPLIEDGHLFLVVPRAQ